MQLYAESSDIDAILRAVPIRCFINRRLLATISPVLESSQMTAQGRVQTDGFLDRNMDEEKKIGEISDVMGEMRAKHVMPIQTEGRCEVVNFLLYHNDK